MRIWLMLTATYRFNKIIATAKAIAFAFNMFVFSCQNACLTVDFNYSINVYIFALVGCTGRQKGSPRLMVLYDTAPLMAHSKYRVCLFYLLCRCRCTCPLSATTIIPLKRKEDASSNRRMPFSTEYPTFGVSKIRRRKINFTFKEYPFCRSRNNAYLCILKSRG